MPFHKWNEISVDGEDMEEELTEFLEGVEEQVDLVRMVFDQKANRLRKGDELPPGVIKIVKVYVAIKRKMSVGDKMAGRHGNKGVISRVLPEEDMPYLEDGTPIEVVLNPLGVPSRMNVGQILEAHLGLALYGLGKKIDTLLQSKDYTRDILKALLKKVYSSKVFDGWLDDLTEKDLKKVAQQAAKEGVYICTRVFDGAKEEEIKQLLELSGFPTSGQVTLYDGRTGVPFEQPVTIGSMYVIKLHHLVDEKIHARSIGPYSLVTQQPLGGKAQFGGQRLGEMEVWALEAYGAAYSLQEFLTVKSDDVIGRTRMYESIVKGDNVLEPGLPESFNVLAKELQALALHIELLEHEA